MTQVPETQFARTPDGVRLAYQVLGDGPSDIVLIPPMSCIDLMWEEPSYAHALNRLARLGRLIVFDLRGFGSSDPVPIGTRPTADDWMEDLGVVMDAVGSERSTLVANGPPSLFALLFSATYPMRTRALVLINASANFFRDEQSPLAPFTPESAEALAVATGELWGTGIAMDTLAPSRRNDANFRRWFARFERLSCSAGEFADRQRWIFQFDMRPFLPSIQAPTLVVARKSRANPHLAQAEYLADHIPEAKLTIAAGIDHLFFTDEADALLDDVEEFLTGIRPVPETDRLLATVMFTDIVDSTRKQSDLGDARWKETLDRHDELVGRELDRYRGRQVNTTGDGVLATFDGPARAVRCTQAIIRGLGALGLEVRAGLHTGEVELRGEDVTGLGVTIGRRVSDLAGAGEILVSRTVTDLVAGSGIEFDDRLEHELKGVPGRWRLYSVRA